MTCSSCKHLKEGDRKEGTCGAYYYCDNLEKYVNGSNSKCNIFDRSYARTSYTCDLIYEEGLTHIDKDTPTYMYVLLLIIMSIIAFISNCILNIN